MATVLDGPIIAYANKRTRKMSARVAQGPLWIVYPYDSDRKVPDRGPIYSRSIWPVEPAGDQIKRKGKINHGRFDAPTARSAQAG